MQQNDLVPLDPNIIFKKYKQPIEIILRARALLDTHMSKAHICKILHISPRHLTKIKNDPDLSALLSTAVRKEWESLSVSVKHTIDRIMETIVDEPVEAIQVLPLETRVRIMRNLYDMYRLDNHQPTKIEETIKKVTVVVEERRQKRLSEMAANVFTEGEIVDGDEENYPDSGSDENTSYTDNSTCSEEDAGVGRNNEEEGILKDTEGHITIEREMRTLKGTSRKGITGVFKRRTREDLRKKDEGE